MAAYVPDAGDFVWIDFEPKSGHEQGGRRPALVLSTRLYNQKAGLFIVCPVTSKSKGYPFEVPVTRECGVSGVILADQVRNLDWRARKISRIGRATSGLVADVRARLSVLIGD